MMGFDILQTDPRAGYLAHQAEIDVAIQQVLAAGWYILGNECQAFENEFAAYLGVNEGIGVANGTDALELALRACGIGLGDGVFAPSHTAVATIAAIERCGAIPLLLDIDPQTYTLSSSSLEAAAYQFSRNLPVGVKRLAAVILVHLYGQPADLPAVIEIAHQYNLRVIEDCAQAHGATCGGRKVSSLGDIAAFSFYPTKNLGALGDGGFVATSDAALAEKVRLLRQYGWKDRYISSIPGVNSRLDELQAAILRVKLRYLDAENARRQILAQIYTEQLGESSLTLPQQVKGTSHVYHQYVVRTPRRKSLLSYLNTQRIGTGIHYPLPVHLQPAYLGRLILHQPLSVTERVSQEVVSLPMYPQLSEELVVRTATMILQWLEG